MILRTVNEIHDVALPLLLPVCFTLGCFRMGSRMRSGGQQDGDLTWWCNTWRGLLSPFHTAGSSCVFPVWCWSFWWYEKRVLAFCPGSNELSSNLGNLCSAIWKKSPICHSVDLPGSNLWKAEIFSVSMAILQPEFDRMQGQVINKLNEVKNRNQNQEEAGAHWMHRVVLLLYKWICSHSALAHSWSISGSLFAPQVPPVSLPEALLPNRNRSGMTMCQFNQLFSIVLKYSPSQFCLFFKPWCIF